MEHATTPPSRPIFMRFLRALIVGILTVFLFYLKILGGILKLGMRAVKKVPLDGSKAGTDKP